MHSKCPGMNTFPAAEIPDRGIATKSFEDDPNLLFWGELAAGNAFDVPDESLCLFGPGLSLPVPV